MMCSDTKGRESRAEGARGIALALWLAGGLLAQDTLADPVFGIGQPHFHDYSSATPYGNWALGESPEGRRIFELRAHLDANPGSVRVAAALARAYLALFRYEGDPGLIALAGDVLAPWDDDVDPPPPVALERAVLWQTEHRFAAALALLERLVQREPRNTRAWLTLAAVSKELGLYAKSRAACGQLLWLSDAVLGGACMASVWAETGPAGTAYSILTGLLSQPTHDLAVDVVVWVHSLGAEAAVAINRPDLAETHFIAALQAAERAQRPPEIYLLVEYADFLVERDRPEDVLELLRRAPRAPSITIREADARKTAKF